MKLSLFPSLLLAIAFLAACGSGNGSTDANPVLTGMEWQWQQTRQATGDTLIPAKPGNYTLRFGTDGTLRLKVDCNRAGGTYHLDNSRITLDITHSTRAMCPPDSLDQEFLRQLGAVVTYILRDGKLYLNMKLDSGNMTFAQ